MDTKVKVQVLNRLSIAEGHLKKVKEMVEEGSYCPDVIHQSRAVQAALHKVDEIILQGHLHSCVFNQMTVKKTTKDAFIKEIVGLYKRNGNH